MLITKFKDDDLIKYYNKVENWMSDIACCKYGNFFVQELIKRSQTWKDNSRALKFAIKNIDLGFDIMFNVASNFNHDQVKFLEDCIFRGITTLEQLKQFQIDNEYKTTVGKHIRGMLIKLVKSNFKFYMTQRYSKFVICPLIAEKINLDSNQSDKNSSSSSSSSNNNDRKSGRHYSELANFLANRILEMSDEE